MNVTVAVLNADYRLAVKYGEFKTFMVSEAHVIWAGGISEVIA
jgi:hypothetical protein